MIPASSISTSTAPLLDARTRRLLLRQVLKRVSRSFYLSLVVLPRAVREQVSLAYLFCRAADTIADTRIIPRDERLNVLQAFRRQFQADSSRILSDDLNQMLASFAPQQGSEGERQLMHHLPDCFQLFGELSDIDQRLIRELVMTLTQGMQMDLQQFPTEANEAPRALPEAEDLDRYTYYVAGVVGEFWTKIHAAHLPALQHLNLNRMCELGIRFGKGLQMTNILKDIGADLKIGRCYLPQSHLLAVDLEVMDLAESGTQERLKPVLSALVQDTLAHLDAARDYVVQLPWYMIRLRLSCLWPLLFAVQTLDVISTSTTLLDPTAKVKISRQAVYRTMLRSLWCLVSQQGFERYYHTLRSRVSHLSATEIGES